MRSTGREAAWRGITRADDSRQSLETSPIFAADAATGRAQVPAPFGRIRASSPPPPPTRPVSRPHLPPFPSLPYWSDCLYTADGSRYSPVFRERAPRSAHQTDTAPAGLFVGYRKLWAPNIRPSKAALSRRAAHLSGALLSLRSGATRSKNSSNRYGGALSYRSLGRRRRIQTYCDGAAEILAGRTPLVGAGVVRDCSAHPVCLAISRQRWTRGAGGRKNPDIRA